VRLDLRAGVVLVVLSRRNLLSLLHKLDMPGSARTLVCEDNRIHGVPTRALHLAVRAERDDEHYGDRLEPAGSMHPRTEGYVASQPGQAPYVDWSSSGEDVSLPAPECRLGYPLSQLEELFGPFEIAHLKRWISTKTIAICDGRSWSQQTGEYVESPCAGQPHGDVVYGHDVEHFAHIIRRWRRQLELRPGIHPRKHPPNRFHGWVVDQHQVWVDFNGNEHEIEQMPTEHVRNVIGFCHEQADRIRAIADQQLIMETLPGAVTLPGAASGWTATVVELHHRHTLPAERWLDQTPLLLALRRRLDDLRR